MRSPFYVFPCKAEMITIKNVKPNSSARKSGIQSGDLLISVNGHEVRDVLDYRFYSSDEADALLLSRDSAEYSATVEKDSDGETGLEFGSYLMDEKKSCRNKCLFCFIDQNPPGMREGIYFKDDDERLSFLQGNYVTLTNMTDYDVERIIKMKISPINVSVHAMDKALRVRLTGNRFAGEKLDYLYRFAGGGTGLNLQFVLCRGINDGEELEYSLSEIKKLPTLISAAFVPAGLTRYRDSLYPLIPYDQTSAATVIDAVEKANVEFKKETGEGRVFCSDEFYLIAKRRTHGGEYYEGYPQYENGVGMLTDTEETFLQALSRARQATPGVLHAATGDAAYPLISALAEKFTQKFPSKKIVTHKIINEFYGEKVTVSGLLTGGDYIKQLKGKLNGSGTLLISRSSLNAEGELFLDGVTPGQLEKELGVKLVAVGGDGGALCEAFAVN